MRWLVVVLMVVGLAGCEPATPATPMRPSRGDCTSSTPRVSKDVRYGTARLQAYDLTVPHPGPSCRPVPLVVWVHGGAFAIGDKSNGMAPRVAWALANGWAIASVNYRLAPAVDVPTQVDDVARAIAHLRSTAAARGIDPDRIALAGHSAGAFLVAAVGTDPSPGATARAVVSLDTLYEDNGPGADPMGQADTGDAPFLVVTRGQAARKQQARDFAAAVGGEVVDISPRNHEQAADELISARTTAFLRENLRRGG